MEEVSAYAMYNMKKVKDKKVKQKTVNTRSNKKNKKLNGSEMSDEAFELPIANSNTTSDDMIPPSGRTVTKNKQPKRNASKLTRNNSSDMGQSRVESNLEESPNQKLSKKGKKKKRSKKQNGSGNASDEQENKRPVKRNNDENGKEDQMEEEAIEPPRKKKSKKNKSSGSSDESIKIGNNLSFTLQQMKIDARNEDVEDDLENSVEVGRKLFNWVLSPVDERKFFKYNWENQPIVVVRHSPSYYKCLLSCEQIDRMVREKKLYFGKNIDVTSYTNGVRETHNPPGRVTSPVLWDYYNNGCSIRILNPQTFSKKIHCLNARLQEYFGCFVGANVYLTPPGKQGFAPHYDDIEAFVLQIEGKKHWKIYAPRCNEEILPRESSPNFNEQDLGDVLMEVTLEQGDLLYFPRGFIHQAHSVEDSHSLHITLSVYQKNSWADLLEKLVPAALKIAIESDPDYRRGLNLHYLHHMGLVQSDVCSIERAGFIATLQTLIQKLFNYAPIDAAVDQMAKQFQIDALPPFLESSEINRTVFGDGEVIVNGMIENVAQIGADTKIKLLRFNILRLIQEDDALRIYHSVNNSREYHGEEPQYLEISEMEAPAIEALIKNYPRYIKVEELPLDDLESKVQIASDLWEVGLLKTNATIGTSKLKSILNKTKRSGK